MVYDDEDDLFVEDFDFVDEDEDDTVSEEEAPQEPAAGKSKDEDSRDGKPSDGEPSDKAPKKPNRRNSSRGGKRGPKQKTEANSAEGSEKGEKPEESGLAEEKEAAPVEEPKEPAVPTDHVVHVYELGKFKRTINREFTSEDAEAFVVEYNRTSSAHCRQSVAAGRDEKPAEAI